MAGSCEAGCSSSGSGSGGCSGQWSAAPRRRTVGGEDLTSHSLWIVDRRGAEADQRTVPSPRVDPPQLNCPPPPAVHPSTPVLPHLSPHSLPSHLCSSHPPYTAQAASSDAVERSGVSLRCRPSADSSPVSSSAAPTQSSAAVVAVRADRQVTACCLSLLSAEALSAASMSRGYAHLPVGPSSGAGLLELEQLQDRGEEDEEDEAAALTDGRERLREDEEDEEEVEGVSPSPLRVHVGGASSSFSSSSSSPSPASVPLHLVDAAEVDRGDSLSSRHSESHPFDQDVRHVEASQMHLLHHQQPTTPHNGAGQLHSAAVPPQPPHSAAMPSSPSTSSSFTSSSPFPAAAASVSSLPSSSSASTAPPDSGTAVHLQVPGAALRKSVSIGDKLAGRAREIAVREGKRLDALVRGLDDEGVDWVEDHILETLDYDSHEDTMNELSIEQGGALHTHYLLLLKVFMMVLIGFVTAMLMYGVSQGVQLLYGGKVAATTSLIQSGQGAGAYFAFLCMNLAITAVGSSLVAILAPHARGGGVPYALSYLNGTNVADYFSPRIVLVKAASLIFTISGGLTLGMEGPFVFIGGGVALLCSNLIDRVFPFFFIGFGLGGRRGGGAFSRVIRNIREERVFMAGGLAAGLAVAFDAPIAGVLFALEGSTTFLTVPVVLRIFGCAMFASFFNDLGHNNFSSQVINHNLIQPTVNGAPPWAFSIPELLPFTVLGLMGGVAGAGATWLNIRMTHWRHHHLEGSGWRFIGLQVAEVAVFTGVTSTVWFVLPYIFGCRAASTQCSQSIEGGAERCPQLQCSEGSYSEIGAFVYSSSDEVARLLFDRSLSYAEDYHVGPLIVYGAAYWLLLVSTHLRRASCRAACSCPPSSWAGMYGRVLGIFVEFLFPSVLHQPGGVRAAGRCVYAGRLHPPRLTCGADADRADGRRHLPAAHHVLRDGGQIQRRLPLPSAVPAAHGAGEDPHTDGSAEPAHCAPAGLSADDPQGAHRLHRRRRAPVGHTPAAAAVQEGRLPPPHTHRTARRMHLSQGHHEGRDGDALLRHLPGGTAVGGGAGGRDGPAERSDGGLALFHCHPQRCPVVVDLHTLRGQLVEPAPFL